jgi:hypothetical protein
VEVAVVESIGGYVNETTEGDDVLCRDKTGTYYLERKRVKTHGVARTESTKVQPASPLAAMLWFVENFVNDQTFARLFRDTLTGGQRADVVRFQAPAQQMAGRAS